MRLHMFSEESVTDVCLCIPAASALTESRFLPPEMSLLLKPGVDTAVQTCIRVSEANAAASTRSWSYSLFMLERQVFGFHILSSLHPVDKHLPLQLEMTASYAMS